MNGIREIPARLRITSINLKIRFALVIAIELFYMAMSRELYGHFEIGDLTFVGLEIARTPFRVITALLFWLLMSDIIFGRSPDMRPLRQSMFAAGLIFALLASFTSQDYHAPAYDMAVVAITAIPVGFQEEFFFRGILQNLITRYLGATAGLSTTVILFVLYHVGVTRPELDNYFFIAISGFILSAIYFKTGSMATVILYHTIDDAILCGFPATPPVAHMAKTALLIVAAVAFGWWTKRDRTDAQDADF